MPRRRLRGAVEPIVLGSIALLATAAGCGGNVDDDNAAGGSSGGKGGVAAGGSSGGKGGTSGTAGGASPCAGKKCGESCSLCTAGSSGCQQGRCDMSGECTNALVLCVACEEASDCPPPPPVCSECPDGITWCAGVECEFGACVPFAPDCGPSPGYDPCAGGHCGSPCQLCNPILSSCIEPPGSRRCFPLQGNEHECKLGVPACPR